MTTTYIETTEEAWETGRDSDNKVEKVSVHQVATEGLLRSSTSFGIEDFPGIYANELQSGAWNRVQISRIEKKYSEWGAYVMPCEGVGERFVPFQHLVLERKPNVVAGIRYRETQEWAERNRGS